MNLNKFSLFQNVNVTDLEYQTKTYYKNQTIYNQGDVCHGISLVISGTLVAYSLSESGNDNVVFNFKSGDVVGANLLFGNANFYPLNIYATSDCEILTISKSQVLELLKDYNFTLNFLKNISLNSQGMNKKIAMSSGKTLRENIVDYLTALSIEQKSNHIYLQVSKKQLADYFAVKRPSLFRELKNMKDDGLIEINNKQIILNFLETT